MSFNLSAILQFSTQGFQKGLANSNRQFQSLQNNMKRAGASVRNMGAGMTVLGGVGTAMAGGIAYAVKEHANLEKQLDSVAAKMSDGEQNYAALEKMAKKMGRETIFTGKEAAQGLEFLALAGFKAKDAIGVLPTILKTAGAGNLDLGRASDIVTDSMSAMAPVMKGFGDRTKQATTLADMMTLAQARTNTNIEQLGEAIKYGGGALANLGVPLDQIIGSMGALANAGLKGSIGGTSLLNMMNKLAKPSSKAQSILAEMGVTMEDLQTPDGKLKSMTEVVKILDEAVSASPGALDKAGAASELFGVRGQKAFFALKNMGSDALNSLFKELQNSSKGVGEASRQYQKMTDNLFGVAKAFQSAVSGIVLEVGKMFTDMTGFEKLGKAATQPLIDLGTALGALNTPMEDWDDEQRKIVKSPIGQFAMGLRDGVIAVRDAVTTAINTVKGFVTSMNGAGINMRKVGKIASVLAVSLATIGPILLGLGIAIFTLTPIVTAVVSAFTFFGSILGIVGSGLALLISPIGLIVAGLVGMGAILYQVMGGWEGVKNAFNAFIDGFMSGFQPAILFFNDEVLPTISAVIDAFGEFFGSTGKGIEKGSAGFTSFGQIVGTVLGTIMTGVGMVIKGLASMVGWIVKAANAVKNFSVKKLFGDDKEEDIFAQGQKLLKPVNKNVTTATDTDQAKVLQFENFKKQEAQKTQQDALNKEKANIVSLSNFRQQKMAQERNAIEQKNLSGAEKVEMIKARNRERLGGSVEDRLAKAKEVNQQKMATLGQGESRVATQMEANRQLLAKNRPVQGQGEQRVAAQMEANRQLLAKRTPQQGQGEARVQAQLEANRMALAKVQAERDAAVVSDSGDKKVAQQQGITNDKIAITSAKSQPTIVNPTINNQMPEQNVEIVVQNNVDENGIHTMVKRANKKSMTKSGDALKSAGIERQAQVAYGG